MDISQTVELVHGHEHLADVEQDMPHGKDGTSCVIEKCTEVASGYVFHGQVDEVQVLERIKQTYKPGRLGSGEDITFHKDVLDLNSERE